MRIHGQFGLTLILIISASIISTPIRAQTNTFKSKKVVQPNAQIRVKNPGLNDKIKVIQPGGLQGKDGDFKDKQPTFKEGGFKETGPTFGEGSPGPFVNFTKQVPGSEVVNPVQPTTPSAVDKFKSIQNKGTINH
jgi:hypothetical protein